MRGGRDPFSGFANRIASHSSRQRLRFAFGKGVSYPVELLSVEYIPFIDDANHPAIVLDIHVLMETDIRMTAVQRIEAISLPLLDEKLAVYNKHADFADGRLLAGVD